MKLTEWYPGDVKPVRKGVYQQMNKQCLGYQYWDGKVWGIFSADAEVAFRDRRFHASPQYQNDPWRGVAK